MTYRAAFLLPLLLTAAPALAQQGTTTTPAADPAAAPVGIDPAKLDGNSLRIGIVGGVTPSYEGSNDLVLTAVPGIQGRVSGINFAIRGNRFSADIVPTPGGPAWDFQAGPIVSLNFNRTRRSVLKDPRVEALPVRKIAVEVGGYVGIGKQGVITSDYDKLSVSVAYTYDIGGIHKSEVITPSIDYGTPLSTKAYVGLGVSANYVGDGYGRTYFSVNSPAEAAASGLPQYRAGKGWKDWTLSGYGLYSLTGDLTGGLGLMVVGSYRRMLGDAARSPLTSIAGSKDQWTLMGGLAYSF